MKTLELKDLKYYLGTGLQWTLQGLRIFTMSGLSEEILHTEEGSVFNWRKHEDLPQALFPLFLPLSALTKPLPDGSIPIVELAKIAETHYKITNKFKISDSFEFGCVYDDHCFWYNKKGSFCYTISTEKRNHVLSIQNQLQLFEYLYQNHFWLGDQSLFETGEIIDKRTLK